MRIYDVSDLIHRDLPAAVREAIEQGMYAEAHGGGGGDGMGGGAGRFGMTRGGGQGQPIGTEEIVREFEMDRVGYLQDLIQRTIAPNTWAPDGCPGSLSYYEGLLVVVHTAKAHQELADLLAAMRQALAARPAGSQPAATAGKPLGTSGFAGG